MRRTILSAGLIVVALILQLSLVDRLPLPGGAPDLVLVIVVALGLTGGPLTGMLAGFWAGLALDVAPPAGDLLGEHALVFCLVGYACGRLSGMVDRSAASSLGIAAVAVAGGEVLQVVVGLMFGDPGVSWPAIRTVLPSSVLQDILVSPFVVYLVMRASRWAAADRHGLAAPGGALPALLAGVPGALRGGLADGVMPPGRPGPLGRTGWLAGAPGSGRGRKAGALGSLRFGKYAARQGYGRLGSGPLSGRPVPAQIRRGHRPRLRPGTGRAGSAIAGRAGLAAGATGQVHGRRPARPVSIRIGSGRRGDGSVGTTLRGGAPGQRAGRGAAGRGAGLPSIRMRRTMTRGAALPGTRTRVGGMRVGRMRVGRMRVGGLRGIGLGRGGLRGIGLGRAGLGGSPVRSGAAGLSTARPVFRPAAQRMPRLRRRSAAGRNAALRQGGFRYGRRSFLARLTRRKPGSRSALGQIGRGRTAGRTGRGRTGGFP